MTYVFPPRPQPAIPITGSDELYPIARIFCVGRNYADHAKEMGSEVDREAPWYFTKSAHAYCPSGVAVPYPPGTKNYHHEMEFAVALGGPAFDISTDQAMSAVFGYGAALDMTRRDRQQDGKDKRRPWSLGKDVENSAVIAPLTRAEEFGPVGAQRLHLDVNGQTRQDGTLADMVWSVAELSSHLSGYYHLGAGDVILTGTRAGVGPVNARDVLKGEIEGLTPLSLTLTDAS